MSYDVIKLDQCPYHVGDLVECIFTSMRSQVVDVVDEHVFCCTFDGREFYRTWSHQQGGLKLVQRAQPSN